MSDPIQTEKFWSVDRMVKTEPVGEILRETIGPEGTNQKNELIPGLPVLREALLAIDRSSLGRLERYFTFFSAI
jgi:hypothetical protein